MTNVKLNFLHVCENAFVSQDGKLSLIGIFNQIKASDFPAAHPKLSIVSSISGDEGEYEEIIEIISPKKDVIAKVVNTNVKILKKGGVANFVANFIGLAFFFEGKYTIRVKINGGIVNEENFILLSK